MKYDLSYYQNLISSEYQGSPKLMAWISVLCQILIDCGNCADGIPAAFDVDNATGAQLDILGVITGINRQLPFQPTSGSPILDDNNYRTLIKAKIAQNQWDGKITSIYQIWNNLFSDSSIMIIDNFDMTMGVLISGNPSLIIRDCARNGMIVPRPEGVELQFLSGNVPFFGFDNDNTLITGFDNGNWYQVTGMTENTPYFGFDEDNSLVTGLDAGNWTN